MYQLSLRRYMLNQLERNALLFPGAYTTLFTRVNEFSTIVSGIYLGVIQFYAYSLLRESGSCHPVLDTGSRILDSHLRGNDREFRLIVFIRVKSFYPIKLYHSIWYYPIVLLIISTLLHFPLTLSN